MLRKAICLCVFLSVWHLTLALPKWDKRLVEAEQIAMESTGFIVPIPVLAEKIMRELKVIRSQYREVEDVVNRQRWIPGQLFARKITDDQLMQIESSSYGPLESVKRFNFGTLLMFRKPYHAEVLSERLAEKYGIMTEPNTSTGDNSQGMIRYDQGKKVYTIEKGPAGYSYPGYRSRHMWKFTVNDGVAKLRSSARPGMMIRGSEEK